MHEFNDAIARRLSRRTLLKGVGAGALGLGLAQAGLAQTGLGGPGLARQAGGLRGLTQARTAQAQAAQSESLQDILDITATVEAFGVTLVGAALASNAAGGYDPPLPAPVVAILTAARAQEKAHYDFFTGLGGVPRTTTFTVPAPQLLTDPAVLFGAFDQEESREIAAQLAALRAFVAMGRPDLVKVSYQYAAQEAEHRLLGRLALGATPPNNYGFAPAMYETVGGILDDYLQGGIIGGSGQALTFPGPGAIDASNVIELTPGGAPVSCTPEPYPDQDVVLIAPLSGAEGAFGFAKVVVNAGAGRVCYRLSAANIAPATAAGIRAGGATVVPFTTPGPDGLGDGCVEVAPELAQAISVAPGNYTVAVANAEYPDGAVRGQLTPL
jgi:hypothetical protein